MGERVLKQWRGSVEALVSVGLGMCAKGHPKPRTIALSGSVPDYVCFLKFPARYTHTHK